jgi:Ferritin-like domain
MPTETTRRGLIRRAIAAGGVGGGAAALLGASSAGAGQTVAPSDAELLHDVLTSELLAAYCYQRLLSSSLLDARSTLLARQILAQEQAHVRALSSALRASGGTLPAPPGSAAEADRALAIRRVPNRIGHVRDHEDARKLLIALEGVLEGSYFVAIGELSDAKTLRLAVEIMANEAQHEATLRLLGNEHKPEKAVPSAFVQGTLPKSLAGSLG